MKLKTWKDRMLERGISLQENWVTTKGEFPFTVHGFRAHDASDGTYLGLLVVQQMIDPEGEPDGVIVYHETQGNDLDADALAIMGMGGK